MFELRALSAAYGPHPALQDVSLTVAAGEIVVILGANGAGKSTLLRAISGVCAGAVSGEVTLDGVPLMGLSADEIVEQGVALVPEGRGIFGDLTVRENLMLGAYSKRARLDEKANLDRVLRLFPKLRERQGQVARTMSGGEQQMVAIGRAMMSAPQILMLDEPSLGLSPLLCKELFRNLAQVKGLGIGVLLVEQNAKQSLAIADRGYLLENTQIVHEDRADRLANDAAVQRAYLGGSGQAGKAVVKPDVRSERPAPAPVPGADVAHPRHSALRRSAEDQIGLSIDDLVQTATQVSASAPRRAPDSATRAAAEKVAQPRVAVLLREIESAAKEARARVRDRQSFPVASAPAPVAAQGQAQDQAQGAKPPVIEVYRRPRVEVYRRRPGGAFERD